MFAATSVGLVHYSVFTLAVILVLAVDLGVFNRTPHKVSFKEINEFKMNRDLLKFFEQLF